MAFISSTPVFNYPAGWNFGTDLNHWQTMEGDFNGDGRTDFARVGPTYMHWFMSNGDGTFSPGTYNYPVPWNFGTDPNLWRLIVGDYNGDGRTDFARVGPTYMHWFMSNGDGTFSPGTYNYPAPWNFGTDPNLWRLIVGDYNGDGRTDFARVGPTYMHWFMSNGDGTFSPGTYNYPVPWNFGTDPNLWRLIVGDFNGDGRTDFARVGPTYMHWFMSNGDGTFSPGTYNYPAPWNFGTDPNLWRLIVGDFNGDGRTDFARVGPTYMHWFMSNGDGTFSPGTYNYPAPWNFGTDPNLWRLIVGDYNGDGRTDFARVGPTYMHWFMSNGDGTFSPGTYNYPAPWNFGTDPNLWQTMEGDFIGDGRTDFARVGPTYMHLFVT